jgi:short-subunit dehydrogenase
MKPLGVKVIVVEPGAVTSAMSGRVRENAERITAGMTPAQKGRYAGLMHAMVSQAESYINKAVPAAEAGRIIADATTSNRPYARYTIGRDATMLAILIKFLPDRIIDSLIARSYKSHFPKDQSSSQ